MPEPRADETQSEFISRCIPLVLEDGTADDQDQAAAVCFSMWEQGTKAELHRYTYNGVTCRASRRRSSSRDDKAWMRDVAYDDRERLVHYADPDMPMRRNNPDARAAFNARHSCDEKRDPFAPGFWACYDWNNPDEKGVTDAPGYHQSDNQRQTCNTCLYGEQGNYCSLFKFEYDNGWVCDSWLPQPAKKIGGKMEHEHKTVEFKITNVDFEGRTVEGYAAVFGNVDGGGDIIHPGAFAKTLSERGNKVKFLWQHDSREPIGKPLELREDSNGLYVKAIVSDTQRGRDALALLRDGAINGMSIGYDAMPGGTDFSKEGDETVRNLRELRLWEFSLVTFPMNELAGVTDLKGASGKTDLPIADRERTWDSTAAIGRIRSATDSTEEPSATYRNAFFWYDTENPGEFGSYKLPFADVVEGRLTAIPAGVLAAAGALQGARGGVDLPDADRSAVQSRIAGYYRRMREQFDDDSLVPPWEKADSTMVVNLKNGSVIINALDLLNSRMGIPAKDVRDKIEEIKAGRAISTANEKRIRGQCAKIIDGVNDLLEMLDTVLPSTAEEETPPAEDMQAGDKDAKANNEAGPTDQSPTSKRQRLLDKINQLMEV